MAAVGRRLDETVFLVSGHAARAIHVDFRRFSGGHDAARDHVGCRIARSGKLHAVGGVAGIAGGHIGDHLIHGRLIERHIGGLRHGVGAGIQLKSDGLACPYLLGGHRRKEVAAIALHIDPTEAHALDHARIHGARGEGHLVIARARIGHVHIGAQIEADGRFLVGAGLIPRRPNRVGLHLFVPIAFVAALRIADDERAVEVLVVAYVALRDIGGLQRLFHRLLAIGAGGHVNVEIGDIGRARRFQTNILRRRGNDRDVGRSLPFEADGGHARTEVGGVRPFFAGEVHAVAERALLAAAHDNVRGIIAHEGVVLDFLDLRAEVDRIQARRAVEAVDVLQTVGEGDVGEIAAAVERAHAQLQQALGQRHLAKRRVAAESLGVDDDGALFDLVFAEGVGRQAQEQVLAGILRIGSIGHGAVEHVVLGVVDRVILGDGYLGEVPVAGECARKRARHAGADVHLLQGGHVDHAHADDCLQRIGEDELLDGRALGEGALVDGGQAVQVGAHIQVVQALVVVERVAAHRLRAAQVHLGNTPAAVEGPGAYGLEAVGKDNLGQGAAARESIFADGAQGVIECNVLQLGGVESVIADGVHGRGHRVGHVGLHSALVDGDHARGILVEKRAVDGAVVGAIFGHDIFLGAVACREGDL